MKKAIHEWAFNLFTKRITIKVAKLPDNEKIEFLANKLMNEMIAQGHEIRGVSEKNEYVTFFTYNGNVITNLNNTSELRFKRLTNI